MKVILFDGDCNFCAASIRFIWKRDRAGVFHFASLQSAAGERVLNRAGVGDERLDSVYLVDGDQAYSQSTAALKILESLPGWGWLGRGLQWIPRCLRDWVYAQIARRRQHFSPDGPCELPPAEVRQRFLDRDES